MTTQQQTTQQQTPPAAKTGNGNGGPAPAASASLTPFQQRFNSFRGTLTRMEKQFAMALPKHIKADRLMRIVLTEITKTPKLLDCTEGSLMGAILQAAQLGLEPGGVLGQSYLVPYRRKGTMECQLIPGYKGLVKLAYQSGEVGAIRARVVRQKDEFNYEYGMQEVLIHKPHRGDDPGALVAVYAVAKIKGIDEEQFLVLERWEIDEIRKRSQSSDNGPWVTDFEEMAKKSAIRRLCKLLPASVENDALAKAIALDEHAEAGIKQEFEGSFIDVTATAVEEKPDETKPADQPQAETKPDKATDPLDKLAAETRAKKDKEKEKKHPPVPLDEMSPAERREWEAKQAADDPSGGTIK